MTAPRISPSVRELTPSLIETRRDLHRNPELGFQETRTSRVVAERLARLGLTPRTGIAKTGVTALLEGGGGSGPTVLVRADMDALPIQEVPGRDHGSRTPGVMHACGHDGHTAMLLALAELLVAERAKLPGRVQLLFQPAEEGPGGAKPMIEAGVLEAPKVDAALGMHLISTLDLGLVGVAPGPIMAAVDLVTITLTAPCGHGAKPHESPDPVHAAGHILVAIQGLLGRDRDPLDPAVLTIGSIHGGSAPNVIPTEVVLRGTLRTMSAGLRSALAERLERLVGGVAAAFGVGARVEVARGYPATCNDAAVAEAVWGAGLRVMGERGMTSDIRAMWSEDFAYFAERVPACFFFVGARSAAKGIVAPHHTPEFDIDEEALPIGVEVMAGAVRDVLHGRCPLRAS